MFFFHLAVHTSKNGAQLPQRYQQSNHATGPALTTKCSFRFQGHRD